MKRFFLIVLMALVTMSGMAQRHHDDRGGHGRHGGRHRVECATNQQMQMTLQVLDQQSFDDKKLEIGKLCVTLGHFCTDDLARMAEKFTFDDKRLEFLTYAFDYCEDPEYYYSLRNVFTFSSNFDTLMDRVMPGYRR